MAGKKEIYYDLSGKQTRPARLRKFMISDYGLAAGQILCMVLLKALWSRTGLLDISFRLLRYGSIAGEPYYIFDYTAGAIELGGGGGLAYFLAVEVTLAVSQILHLSLNRNRILQAYIPMKRAAAWYAAGFVLISIGAAALQGFYKYPLYQLLWSRMGIFGVVTADIVVMIVNCALSYWVYFPIYKIVFKQETDADASFS